MVLKFFWIIKFGSKGFFYWISSSFRKFLDSKEIHWTQRLTVFCPFYTIKTPLKCLFQNQNIFFKSVLILRLRSPGKLVPTYLVSRYLPFEYLIMLVINLNLNCCDCLLFVSQLLQFQHQLLTYIIQNIGLGLHWIYWEAMLRACTN